MPLSIITSNELCLPCSSTSAKQTSIASQITYLRTTLDHYRALTQTTFPITVTVRVLKKKPLISRRLQTCQKVCSGCQSSGFT